MTQGWAIWLTGLPSSGKTTVGEALQAELCQRGVVAAVLDSDVIRHLLTPDMAYTAADRDQFYERLTALAVLLTSYDVNVIIAATAHRRLYRDCARAQIERFAEIWTRCPAEICRSRDTKGLYAQVQQGKLDNLPGVHVPFEPPLTPELVIDTDTTDVEQAVAAILQSVPFLAR